MSPSSHTQAAPDLIDGRAVLSAPFPTLKVGEASTPSGTAWVGTCDGKIAWLSLGPLDKTALQTYWSGPIEYTKASSVSNEDLEAAACRKKRLPLMPIGTPFQMQVWQLLRGIAKGETVTYGELAERMGDRRKARSIGTAVGANPIAWLIPCHRVLPANGGIGGYRWDPSTKAALLDSEGVPIKSPADKQHIKTMLLNAQRIEDLVQLSGNIAHDFNNLLAPIRMAMEMLKRKVDDPSAGRYLDIIETSTARARAVIQEILSFSQAKEINEKEQVDIPSIPTTH